MYITEYMELIEQLRAEGIRIEIREINGDYCKGLVRVSLEEVIKIFEREY